MAEEEIQEEIVLNTIKEWLLHPIKIVHIEEIEEKDAKLRQYFKNKHDIENIFYRDFDELVNCINKRYEGYYHVRVNNIDISVEEGAKPIEEDE
jgi:hypothetical protein